MSMVSFLSLMLRRSFPAFSRPKPETPKIVVIDWLPAKARLIERVAAEIGWMGLEYQSAMQWTEREPSVAGIRRIFRVHHAGALRPLTVNWGYALDCVPHRSVKGIAWHRSFATAQADLSFLPESLYAQGIEHIYGDLRFDEDLTRVLNICVPRARDFWARRHDLAAVRELLALANVPYEAPVRPAFDGYAMWRSVFALPFVMAELGDHEALAELERTMINRDLPAEVQQVLREKLRQSLARMG
ncbi:MAG: hypothetical protein CFE34_16755 [Rhodobacteraceae bacterium PARR1]|nr:MAG: hypothetical protein CFE34_16755 [Rhodobacteraceae bacterium PARR1]